MHAFGGLLSVTPSCAVDAVQQVGGEAEEPDVVAEQEDVSDSLHRPRCPRAHHRPYHLVQNQVDSAAPMNVPLRCGLHQHLQ